MAITTSFGIFEEYNRLVGKADITKGVYDPRGHAVSFCYPKCLPERIDVLTRMQEVGYFQDDAIDATDTPVEITAFEEEYLAAKESYENDHPNLSQLSTFAGRYNRPEYMEHSPIWSNGPGDRSIHCSSNLDNDTPPESETLDIPDRVCEIPLEQQRRGSVSSLVIECDTIVREISAEVWKTCLEVLYLYSSSLMLDDIQDQSALRRGSPATHVLFGEAQTINSANFLVVLSLEELYKLHHPQSTVIYNAQLRRLHIGQSMDLYWTRHVTCPTVAEYIDMVDHKTGGLFNLAGGLMQAEGSCNGQLNLDCLMTLLGRYFQIRDDYSNIVSANYASAKGFCEDLDEGKFLLLLVHALRVSHKQKHRLQAIMQERRHNGSGMSIEMKGLVLEMLRVAGSPEYVKGVIRKLEDAIDTEIRRIEGVVGEENYVKRLLLERLRVD
ncbi:hypothetical protein V496_04299 [Pseudogymnoascus sp. VKM F-4515 (FW-2607)]|nr:hypothetical protein V496_04299 [Pseudogymnoascus sp. VKM F-4515 (FW-2607)]